MALILQQAAPAPAPAIMIVQALLAQAVLAVFLTLLLGSLRRALQARPLFFWWTLAWGALAIYFLGGVAGLLVGAGRPVLKQALLLLSVLGGFAHVGFLVTGVLALRDAARARQAVRWIVPLLCAVGAGSWAVALGVAEPALASSTRALGREAVTAAGYFAAAVVLVRSERRRPRPVGLVVLATVCVLYGLGQLVYLQGSIAGVARGLGVAVSVPDLGALARWQVAVLDLAWEAGIGFGAALFLLEENRRAADLLARAATDYRVLVETSPLPIIALDERGRVQIWNAAAERLLGWRAAEVVGREPPRMADVPEPRFGYLPEPWASLFVGEQLMNRPYLWERPDGQKVVLGFSGAPVRSADGMSQGAVAVLLDLTELRRLQEQVGQQQRMEALGRFAAGIAHDFNNMLTAILGASDLLRAELSENHPARAEAAAIEEAALRGAELVRRLLAFGRRQPGDVVEVDVSQMLHEFEALLRRLVGAHREIVLELGTALPQVRLDRSKLEQVVTNLVANARDAMPDGGTVHLRTSLVVAHDPVGGVRPPVPAGRYVRLDVRDEGTGMDADTVGRIFEPFFTTKPAGRGTGLGLATVYAFVEELNGQIAVESAPGHGSTFSILLPVA